MSTLENQVKRIQEKLQRVLKGYDDVLKENRKMKKEIDKIRKQSQQYLETIDQLKQQTEVLKISSGNWDENDKKEFEKRINQYIREIDKCIALLGN